MKNKKASPIIKFAVSNEARLILASGSPRRIELLKMLGCKFKIIPSKIEEKINPRLSPIQNVKRLSRQKALDVASRVVEGIIIAADSIVVLNGEILGKPKNIKDAEKMLRKLSNKEHQAITGVAVINAKTKKIAQDTAITRVRIRKLNKGLIKRYFEAVNPLDKAGAYAIQENGAMLIETINGSYSNVIGLPLDKLNKLLEKFGVSLL